MTNATIFEGAHLGKLQGAMLKVTCFRKFRHLWKTLSQEKEDKYFTLALIRDTFNRQARTDKARFQGIARSSTQIWEGFGATWLFLINKLSHFHVIGFARHKNTSNSFRHWVDHFVWCYVRGTTVFTFDNLEFNVWMLCNRPSQEC